MPNKDTTAVVLFSGGQDSTTCLAWALERFEHVETIGFDYGQRHSVELECRLHVLKKIGTFSASWRKRLGDDHVIDVASLNAVSDTALTREDEIEMGENGLPTTFVPGRNIVFMTFASAVAYRRGAKHLVTGVCETDYSGYPDCRDDTMKALQLTLNLGMEARFVIHTPLMWIDKSQTWKMAEDLGGPDLLNLIIHDTHTCYLGDRSHLHAWGYGCGECPACEIRAEGYAKFVEGTGSVASAAE